MSAATSLLVVDDDPIIRALVVGHLAKAGFRLLEAANGFEALAILERQPADLIVTDLQMPGMDGYALLKQIRQSHPLARSIVMTSYVSQDSVMSCLRSGAIGFVTKPLGDMTDLDQAIALGVAIIDGWRRQLVNLQRLRGGQP